MIYICPQSEEDLKNCYGKRGEGQPKHKSFRAATPSGLV